MQTIGTVGTDTIFSTRGTLYLLEVRADELMQKVLAAATVNAAPQEAVEEALATES